ncbi:oligoendopeptidase F [Dolosicoccus paucivorans]|uniref:Oligopeptidase F n=1 Tax=Dolosicoccus paucivorans TaxID=84521 RepID=A0A2N6SLG4_9LACT|nr:oligoendopeptidase F [Dolosicoccus paucivorans]PMB83798.1 oligoendopeptidase F [Dolosicoccus paucivorans]PMC57927.1 oligoendopeptidase F [Dolosicoccus paucivorans]
MTNLPLRQEVPLEETWDLSLLFDDQQTYEKAVERLIQLVEDFNATYEGALNDLSLLKQSLFDYETLSVLFAHVMNYSHLALSVDRMDSQVETNALRGQKIREQLDTKLSFYTTELAVVPKEIIDQLLKDADAKKFAPFVKEILRQSKHHQSKEVEEVLSQLSGTLYSSYPLYETLKFEDLTFDSFEADGRVYANDFLTFEGEFEGHPSVTVRHKAWQSFHEGLAKYQNTAGMNYINHVQMEKKMATLRGFDSVIDYLLFQQQVIPEVYHRQIDTLMKHFSPVMQRYATLLKKKLGLNKITLADIKANYTTEDVRHITIEESQKMVMEALQPLGEEYQQMIQQAYDERWIDFAMNQTKSTGGFCASIPQGPSYILLNWTGLMSEVLTLVHEFGHAGHFQWIYANQPAINPEPSLYFIEAPSTANEVIAMNYLLNQPLKDAEKVTLIADFVSKTYFHNMVTHLLEADFQRKVYEALDRDEILTVPDLNRFFKETLQSFWQDAVEINEGAELTWMRQPHYFIGLYPYTYSAGLTIGTQVGEKIARGDTKVKDQWLEVLSLGGTRSPMELAKLAGVSMESGEAILFAIDYVSRLLDELEACDAIQ